MGDQDLYSGLIRLHVLHHAAEEPVFGLGLIEELARHGYTLSPGTLYPILHGLEARGYLRSARKRVGKAVRRFYCITPRGRRVLEDARAKVRELFGELFERSRADQPAAKSKTSVQTARKVSSKGVPERSRS